MVRKVMTLNLVVKFYLAALFVSGIRDCASGYHSLESQDVRNKRLEEKEVGNGTVQDTLSKCHNTSSFSDVPACSSPWTYCDNGTCKCADTEEILCLPSGQALVQADYCITFDEAQALTQLGQCDFVEDKDGKFLLRYDALPSNVSELDGFVCGPFNRTGMLCGKCKDGYYPLVNSLDVNCVQCPNGWSNLWKFVMVVFLPLTVFYFIILLFRVNATSSQLQGFIYCCQGIALAPLLRDELIFVIDNKRRETTVRTLGLLYGIWNLDFLRSLNLGLCLQVDTLTALALDVAVGVYPLLLILITYVLIKLYDRNFTPLVTVWRPFATFLGLLRRNWDIKTSLVDAFITFLYLCSVKFMSVSFDMLAPVHVKQLDSAGNVTESWHLYYDPTIPYFGKKHIPYAVLALSVLTLFVILPTLVLLLYPFACFQKVLNTLPIRQHVLHTFMDSFLGCYKDGTQPDTRDCRWFASLLFSSRLLVLLIGALTLNWTFYIYSAILVVSSVTLMNIVEPFKKESKHLYTNTFFMLLLSLIFVFSVQLQVSVTTQPYYPYVFIVLVLLVSVLPLLYLSALIVHWLYSHSQFGGQMVRTLQAWRHGYQTLN